MLTETLSINNISTDDTFSLDYPKIRKYSEGMLGFAVKTHYNGAVSVEKSVSQKSRIICGWKNYCLARALKQKHIDTVVIDTRSLTNLDILHIALWDKINSGSLNDIERSIILMKLNKIAGLKKDEIISVYMPLIGLNPSEYLYKEYLSLLELEEPLKKNIASGELSPKVGALLNKYKKDERMLMVELIKVFHLGKSKALEIFELIEKVSLQEKLPIINIIRSNDMRGLTKLARAHKGDFEVLKKYLYSRANPSITAGEKRFKEIAAAINLPAIAKLEHSPYFEKNSINIKAEISSAQQLRSIIENISSAVDKGVFDKLLEINKK